MSTLKANAINNISASVGGITIDSSGTVSGSLPSPNRNLLYNGATQISQRGTSTTSITTSGYYTADRWNMTLTTAGTWTQDIQNDAPTGSGFRRSLRVLCTTADASPSAGDRLDISQYLEGQDLQRIRKGTSSAQRLTLSFWVKTNVTGTYVVELFDNDNTRQVSATYSISAGDSGNWVRRIVTFPADTTGAFDNDNALSLALNFFLVAGSNLSSGTLNTTWASSVQANRAAGQVNVASAINNYWQITGVQLETGDATEFEFKSFGQELRECQRYYVRWNATETTGAVIGGGVGSAVGTGAADWYVPMPVPLRANATAIETSNLSCYDVNDATNRTGGTFASTYAMNTLATQVRYSQTNVFTRGEVVVLSISSTGYLGISAEL